MKHFGVTLIKQVKDLNDKNFKPLKKEIEEDLRKWKDLLLLMDWKDQHFKNGNPTKSNLQIQHNPHQNSNTVLHRSGKGDFSGSYGRKETNKQKQNS